MTGDTIFQQPGLLIVIFGFLSLFPFLVIIGTSFVKLSAVFSILRSALGTPQIPPNIVITGLSLILTLIIMMPVAQDFKGRVEVSDLTWQKLNDPDNIESVAKTLMTCLHEPVEQFFKKHAHEDERIMMSHLSSELYGEDGSENEFLNLMVAFLLSELKEAFQIGFLLFLPFIIIDLVVANVLQAFGMVMLSPTTISLPFKLLLFVLSDGWYLVTKGLLSGYM
ncbi:EscR/YscR/HrcR family type III secretion system export apparatus protein [bacterium]|nr:EscR/YscR/HrcR family type III secretion system export apparatus protein [candidate division CSSED10-310 bacterium]